MSTKVFNRGLNKINNNLFKMLSKQNNQSNQYSKKVQKDERLEEQLKDWCLWDYEVCLWSNDLTLSFPLFEDKNESMQTYQKFWSWEIEWCASRHESIQHNSQLFDLRADHVKFNVVLDSSRIPVKTRRRNTNPPNIESNLLKILELQIKF